MSADKPNLKKRGGLGKGLGALLSDANVVNRPERDADSPALGAIAEIPVEAIQANPYQPRTEFDQDALDELSESIQLHGLVQPITVRRLEEGVYQLISGERRWRASKQAGLEAIPAYVRTANDQQMLEMAIIENIQREDLNPMEVALSYQRLMVECELRQEDLGKRVGKKRATVANYLRLLRLPTRVQAALRDRQLSMGHARALIAIDDMPLQLALFDRIVKEGLSVRKVEELVNGLAQAGQAGTPKAKPESQPLTDEQRALLDVQQRLSSRFGTQVRLHSADAAKGEIRIPFYSPDDLNRLLDLLGYA